MEKPIELSVYDLSCIICFLQPDSHYAKWAFELPHNHSQLPPLLRHSLSDPAAKASVGEERETTPIIGATTGSREIPVLLAVTTVVERLFNPEGHILGSDIETNDYILDDSRRRGVSSKHLRLFIDPEEGQDSNLTLQNLSPNSVKVISHGQRINETLNQGQQILLDGGTWSVYLNTTVEIVFKLIFPDHGKYAAEYNRNWSAFYAANLAANNTVPNISSMNIRKSAEATPLVKCSPYIIDWTDNGSLGKGTFGIVRKASSHVTGEVFAAKVFKKHGVIHTELGFLQILRHKHIVKYNAFIKDRGHDILIMELLDGGTLRDKLKQCDDLNAPIPWAKLYWSQLVGALKYLHRNNVIHRDIKPENIIFNASGDPKLCDFGISKQLSIEEDTTGTQTGSPHHAAPEAFDGKAYSFPADIWSLGIVVLEMYGSLPPKIETWRIAGSDDSAWNRWLSSVLTSVRGLSQDLDLLKQQLMQDPELRSTAESLSVDLKEQHSIQTSSSAGWVRPMKRDVLERVSTERERKRKDKAR